mgnify:CR=1 FL=1
MNAYTESRPVLIPHIFALSSIPFNDLGWGKSLNSEEYAFIALSFISTKSSISTKVFGENLSGKLHSVEDRTSNEYISLIGFPGTGRDAAITARYVILWSILISFSKCVKIISGF